MRGKVKLGRGKREEGRRRRWRKEKSVERGKEKSVERGREGKIRVRWEKDVVMVGREGKRKGKRNED